MHTTRAAVPHQLMICDQLPPVRCRHAFRLDDLKRLSGRNRFIGFIPSTIMSPDFESEDRDKPERPGAPQSWSSVVGRVTPMG